MRTCVVHTYTSLLHTQALRRLAAAKRAYASGSEFHAAAARAWHTAVAVKGIISGASLSLHTGAVSLQQQALRVTIGPTSVRSGHYVLQTSGTEVS